MFVYIQSSSEEILRCADGMVYNMALHDISHMSYIKKLKKPFLLVHGGFQGRMAPIPEIVEFSKKWKPKLIIAPDIYKDQTSTTSLTEQFVQVCGNLIKRSAAVIQGGLGDFEEVLRLYDRWGFKWVAIPSDNYSILGLVDFIKEQGWKIHILGARWGGEIIHNGVDSIDIVADDFSRLRGLIAWKKFIIPTECKIKR